MASTNRCEYCGSTITSDDRMCPSCGAANPLYVVDLPRRVTDPKTIAELQEYCAERGMPLLRMRFFIGEDFKEPKAFGIYKDSHGDCIVYKNKADGTRAVRYRGPDEEHAVREIHEKLLEECRKRGIYPDGKPSDIYRETPQNYGTSPEIRDNGSSIFEGAGKNKLVLIILIAIVLFIIFSAIRVISHGGFGNNSHFNGYYGYNGGGYYNGGYYNGGYYDGAGNNYYNDNGTDSGSSWWWSTDDDDDDSGSSWWSSDDDDDDSGSSWWSSDDDDDDWSSSWDDDDWGSDWSDWDSDSSDWDSDW